MVPEQAREAPQGHSDPDIRQAPRLHKHAHEHTGRAARGAERAVGRPAPGEVVAQAVGERGDAHGPAAEVSAGPPQEKGGLRAQECIRTALLGKEYGTVFVDVVTNAGNVADGNISAYIGCWCSERLPPPPL